MKTRLLILLLILSTVTLLAVDNIIQSFTASSDGKVINIEWRSGIEAGVIQYDLERACSDNIFNAVETIKSKGNNNTYKFTDQDVFLKDNNNNNLMSSIYYYRLKITKSDNSFDYSNNISVTHNVSGIRRTWGMIKALFR